MMYLTSQKSARISTLGNTQSNFEFLKKHEPLFYQLAQIGEYIFAADPNTTLLKMRQLAEAIAQSVAATVGVEYGGKITQLELLKELNKELNLGSNVNEAFHHLRKLGNQANHEFTSATHAQAMQALKIGRSLAFWYHKTFNAEAAKSLKLGEFIKPEDPSAEIRQLEEQHERLKREHQRAEDRATSLEKLKQVEEQKAEALRLREAKMAEEMQVWESVAEEQEATILEYQQKMDSANVAYFAAAQQQTADQKAEQRQRIEKSAFQMGEAETRALIDAQLSEAGWEANTDELRYSKGARPEHGINCAIAEWPTASGPADYVLFIGQTPVAVVEAKRQAKNVYSAIDQAKRYAQGLKEMGAFSIEQIFNKHAVPLVFATNGRQYLKQLEQESGIWSLDVRDNTHRRKALKGWYKPEELKAYLRSNPVEAEQKLDDMDFNYQLELRDYQKEAILSVEKAIKEGKDRALVAMATGTGKTKTCIAMVYRLLKAERFRRILFLVDRSALGVQASNDFGEVRLESLNTFADTFEVMGMEADKQAKASPNDGTKVHVATVQGLVKRLMYPGEDQTKPSVGQYDCIVVDECHRGYLLDRELSDTEIEFRDQQDYQSKYRTVIDYFDAFKVGLTATPALHTTDIFGEPVYSYSYTEAVVDGYLVDHQPPVRILTKLAEEGIKYEVNDTVQVYRPEEQSIDLVHTADELNFDVSQFNRQIINPKNTEVVCKWLIEKDVIDPYGEEKTLIFCVTDKHADQVVEALKQACEDYHGGVDDDAIQKITGSVDKPLEKIRRYKNDRLPNIAVTVDLLTTGVDVPSICNLVFLRRVNSRILFEQMLGRATRRCPEIAKERFRIYDAVDIYKQLEKVNSMKPVVTKVDITFGELEQELQHDNEDLQTLARNQFLAKLQSKKRYLSETQLTGFEKIAGKPPQEFAQELKQMPITQVAEWFTQNPGLGEILDMKLPSGTGRGGLDGGIVLSEHDDEVIDVVTGYGDGQKPEDYLQAFTTYVNANSNRLAALQLVVTRPWELTRSDLKELMLELEKNNFREQDIKSAWKECKNEDIAARIIGFIRQAALGEALVPWEQRVDNALATILASQEWKKPQKDWLEMIAKQMKANTLVDASHLNEGVFRNRLGGIKRAENLFKQQPIAEVLNQFNQALWQNELASA